MPKMITGDELRRAVEAGTFIQGGSPGSAEGIKYDFRVSNHILKATLGGPVDASGLSPAEKAALVIEPGEMVFVLSEERLALPMDMKAELSPKRKLSHAGVLALGGFCIDPGYTGPLLVGLYNFSSTRFPLLPGKKVIGATFYRLEGTEVGNFPIPPPMEDFPDELIQVMQKYSPVATKFLLDSVESLRAELNALRQDIHSHDEWYRRFEQSLEHHDKQIGQLLGGLADEKDARVSGQDNLSKTLSSIEQTLSWLKGAAWVIAGIITLIGVPVIVAWLIRLFGLSA